MCQLPPFDRQQKTSISAVVYFLQLIWCKISRESKANFVGRHLVSFYWVHLKLKESISILELKLKKDEEKVEE